MNNCNTQVLNLKSTVQLHKQRISQIGLYAHIRNMRNSGIDFYDAYVILFGKIPARY